MPRLSAICSLADLRTCRSQVALDAGGVAVVVAAPGGDACGSEVAAQAGGARSAGRARRDAPVRTCHEGARRGALPADDLQTRDTRVQS